MQKVFDVTQEQSIEEAYKNHIESELRKSMEIDAGMSPAKALKILNIEDYGEQIFNSNSHGELWHFTDYLHLASVLKGAELEGFRHWFVETVKHAQKKYQRPVSVFQHIRDLWYRDRFIFNDLLKRAEEAADEGNDT